MKVSDILLANLKAFEGCKLTSYKCPAGVWTIGYGHTKDVTKGLKITSRQADVYLLQDLAPIETYLNSMKHDWTQGQFDACVDFCFNLGTGAFGGSTLRKYILANKTNAEIQAQFNKWVYAGKKKLSGLVKRRAWEAQRWTE